MDVASTPVSCRHSTTKNATKSATIDATRRATKTKNAPKNATRTKNAPKKGLNSAMKGAPSHVEIVDFIGKLTLNRLRLCAFFIKNEKHLGQCYTPWRVINDYLCFDESTLKRNSYAMAKRNIITIYGDKGKRNGNRFTLDPEFVKFFLKSHAIELDSAPIMGESAPKHALKDEGSYEEDRQKKNLSVISSFGGDELEKLTEDDIAFFWPALAKAGFSSDQIKQILQRRARVGGHVDKIKVSLDYADWELAKGDMTDKDGNAVTNPTGYLFSALARTGYYRRPPDYVSPEEQAAKDLEHEARQVHMAQIKAQKQAFKTWREALTRKELNNIMANRIGPEEQWLMNHFRQHVLNQDQT